MFVIGVAWHCLMQGAMVLLALWDVGGSDNVPSWVKTNSVLSIWRPAFLTCDDIELLTLLLPPFKSQEHWCAPPLGVYVVWSI